MNNKLKPCPWCNETFSLDILLGQHPSDLFGWVYVECTKCGAHGPGCVYNGKLGLEECKREAAERWNQMVTTQIVHCKQCRYGDELPDGKYQCIYNKDYAKRLYVRSPDWFCADGDHRPDKERAYPLSDLSFLEKE